MTIDNCSAVSWDSIGFELTHLIQLESLTILGCAGSSAICQHLKNMKSLKSLRMGSSSENLEHCRIQQHTVQDITSITQLEVLRLCIYPNSQR